MLDSPSSSPSSSRDIISDKLCWRGWSSPSGKESTSLLPSFFRDSEGRRRKKSRQDSRKARMDFLRCSQGEIMGFFFFLSCSDISDKTATTVYHTTVEPPLPPLKKHNHVYRTEVTYVATQLHEKGKREQQRGQANPLFLPANHITGLDNNLGNSTSSAKKKFSPFSLTCS